MRKGEDATCRGCGHVGPLGGLGPDRVIPLIVECGPCAWRAYPAQNPVPPVPTKETP